MSRSRCVVAPPPGGTRKSSRSGVLSYKCRHAIRLERQKKKRDPVRVVGVPESGNNPSLKRTKVEPHFTATSPSWRTSAQHLDDSRKVPNPPINVQPGGFFSGILTNLIMLSLASKKKEVSPRVEQLPQVKPFNSDISCVFCVITRDQFGLKRRDLALSWPQPAAGGSQALLGLSPETLQQFNFLKSAWL